MPIVSASAEDQAFSSILKDLEKAIQRAHKWKTHTKDYGKKEWSRIERILVRAYDDITGSK
jgi:hypothetical protein